jgi:mannonate dehydratase
MKMAFRWYGDDNDNVTLDDIRQIPGVETIVWALHNKQAGEVWTPEEIDAEIKKITGKATSKGYLDAEVVESVNIHEAIKTGKTVLGLSRDEAIANYKVCIENLGKAGVKVITYNFMPVFDWLRTDMWHELPDGSTALYYDAKAVAQMAKDGPQKLIDDMEANSNGLTLPGWEPERLAHFKEINEAYQGIGHPEMYENYKYFLDAVIPTCEKFDVKLAVHPDDPSFDLFGWPRVVSNKQDLQTVLDLNPSPYNGLCLCLGSFGSNPNNDPVDAVKSFVDRIHFSHVRNIKFEGETIEGAGRTFSEVGHRASEGDVDTTGIIKAYAAAGYKGYIRPDHGRHLWTENTTQRDQTRPGYGLYDRALGVQYLLGVWDSANY